MVLVLVVIIIAAVALFSLGRALFSSSNSSDEPQAVVNTGKQALVNTTADRSVRMTVRGPIVADEKFHSYMITVSPSARHMTTYAGYVGQQLKHEQLPNNVKAYEEFVFALDRANLMEGAPLPGEANDTRGICATGYVYEFEVRQGENAIQKLWTSSCSGSRGSLTANTQQVMRLFRVQIPTFSEMIRGLGLNA